MNKRILDIDDLYNRIGSVADELLGNTSEDGMQDDDTIPELFSKLYYVKGLPIVKKTLEKFEKIEGELKEVKNILELEYKKRKKLNG